MWKAAPEPGPPSDLGVNLDHPCWWQDGSLMQAVTCMQAEGSLILHITILSPCCSCVNECGRSISLVRRGVWPISSWLVTSARLDLLIQRFRVDSLKKDQISQVFVVSHASTRCEKPECVLEHIRGRLFFRFMNVSAFPPPDSLVL